MMDDIVYCKEYEVGVCFFILIFADHVLFCFNQNEQLYTLQTYIVFQS